MESNHYNIINKIRNLEINNKANNRKSMLKQHISSGNFPSKIEREINKHNNRIIKINKINDLILSRKLNQRISNENINYNKSSITNENYNKNDQQNKRKNHTVFVRDESKNIQSNTSKPNQNNQKEISLLKAKIIENFNNSNTNKSNSSIKANTPLISFKNYTQIKNPNIPYRKSIQLSSNNIPKNSNTNNSINEVINANNTKIDKIKVNKKININSDIQQKSNLYKIPIRRGLSSIQKNEDKIEEKNENLMDVVNKKIGILNSGNTCFINSGLQIFIHCQLFIQKLMQNMKLINHNTPITSNFISICNSMLNSKIKYIGILDFKKLFGNKHKLFSGSLQNDSQEFNRIFLEDISQELNEVKINTIYRLLSNSDSKSKKMRDRDFHENFSKKEKSIITQLFYAQIVNIYTCKCKSAIYSFQKILDFPLLFPNQIFNNMITLHELLKFYFQVEYIEFESKCQKCHQIEKHKKELKISRPPEILILSLQRIDLITEKKLQYKVKFPQKLDIFEFVDHDCGYDKESKYDLFGIINHVGRLNSGHYYSFIKNKDNEWIEYNDAKVNEIKDFSDCSDSVYALFYIKEKYNNNSRLLTK